MKDLLKLMLIPQDKANHYIWSYLLCGFVFTVAAVINYVIGSECDVVTMAWIAYVVTITLGILKEVYDYYSHEGTSSWGDVIADIAGASAFVIVVYL
jgi:uncharacterized protein YfiM (DUF2279 family)